MGVPAIITSFDYRAPSPAGADVQEFSLSGTWVKPPGASMIMVECIGGGGGGAGAFGYLYSGATTPGSGGGGGAGYSTRTFPAAVIPSTVPVTIAAGGNRGTGATTNSGASTDGGNGGTSFFGTILAGYGGGGGQANTGSGIGAGGGVFSGASMTNPGRPSVPSAASGDGHFGGTTSNSYTLGASISPMTSGSVWGGGTGGGGTGNRAATSSLLGGGGGGGTTTRGTTAPGLPGGAGGLSGNTFPATWAGSTIPGGPGADGVAGSGGYAGNPAVYDAGTYAGVVKYSTYYLCPTQISTVGNGPALANLYTTMLRSTDGVTWTLINTNVKIFFVFIGIDNNLYGVATTNPLPTSTTTMSGATSLDFYTSTDGQTWTYFSTVVSPSTGLLNGIPAIVNGNYVLNVGNNTTAYIYSTNLITWTSAALNTATSILNPQHITGTSSPRIIYVGTEYLATASNTATTNLQVATNIAGPWTLRTTNIAGGIQNLVTNGTRIVALFTTPSPYMHYSDNGGTTWTITTGTLTGVNGNFLSIFSFINGGYIGSYLSNLYYSTDGIAWSTATDGTTDNYSSVVFADAKYTVTSFSATSTVVIYATTPAGVWSAATFTSYGAGGAGGNGGYPGAGGGSGGMGETGGAGGVGGGGMVRVTSW